MTSIEHPSNHAYWDRTEEFFHIARRSQNGSNQTVGRIRAPSVFYQAAQHLVLQCESLELGIHQFISLVDSLDFLLSKSENVGSGSGGASSERYPPGGRTYHELLREISQIQQATRQLEESINNNDRSQEEIGAIAFRRGVIAYLYSRVSIVSHRFRQGEACRLERESKLRSLFSRSASSPSCPPLIPLLAPPIAHEEPFNTLASSEGPLGFPVLLAPFLPPRWQRVLLDPKAALPSIPDADTLNAEWTARKLKDPQPQANHDLVDANRTEHCVTMNEGKELTGRSTKSEAETWKPQGKETDKRIYASQRRLQQPQQQSIQEGLCDVPEDIKRDLENETRHLLLEREVDRVDEMHVHRMQRHLAELSMMDAFFSSKVLEQQEICDNVVDLMGASVGHLESASKELSKAEKRGNSYRLFMIAAYVTGSVLLLICDFLTSRKRY